MKQAQPNHASATLTDAKRYRIDPTRRWPTRHRGIRYRLSRSLERTYFVSWNGSSVPAGRTEAEALTKQAELRRSAGRGEQPTIPTKITFAQLAEQWFAAKSERLRRKTIKNYRDALDLVLLPRFGGWRIAAIDPNAISELIRDLQREGLHALDRSRKTRPLGRSSVENYLKPLQGVLALALRRGLIATNPFSALTVDDRPKPEEPKPAHEWSDDDVNTLLQASERLAARPESRYDYTPLLRVTATLGLRLGEVLGLRWEDFDKDAGTLHVRRQWTRFGEYAAPKTRAGVRRIAIPTDLRDELIALRLRSDHSRDAQPIFASKSGTPLMHRNVVRRGFEPIRNEAGLTNVTFHSLRGAAVSRLIRASLDPVTVADFIGHEDPHTTLRVYASLWDRQKTDEAIRLALGGQSPASRTQAG